MASKYFQQEAVYQVYCRSFCDSNGDGIGDIPGIISKLDYIKSLGVGIIWLNPIYVSPQFDIGYDVADYYSINPEYGTMEDFDRLLLEAKKRGLRIVMDLVVNHTSDQHPWFIASKDPKSPYHDYYIWKKGKKNNKKPPNNWTSMFSGPAWTYCPENDLWYLRLYAKEQPDLNWHNPKVLEEVENILRFYLDKGVYGFRCDVINQIYKNTYEDGKGHSPTARGKEHYLMTEGNHQILRAFYDDVFSKYDCMVVGETYEVDVENGIRFLANHEMDMFFQFDSMGVDRAWLPIFKRPFSATRFKDILYGWQKTVDWNANYFENHDQLRSVDRFGDLRYWKPSAKALALLLFGLRGTPFVFQGQEIGMVNPADQDPKDSRDVSAHMVDALMKKMLFPKGMRKKLVGRFDRDKARTPMQWDDSVSAGFSTNQETWIPVNPRYPEINVALEEKDPDSILHFYRRIIELHKKEEALHLGAFHPIPTKGDLLAFSRDLRGQSFLFLINLGKKNVKLPLPLQGLCGHIVLSNYPDSSLEGLATLRPYESLLLQMD